MDYDADGDLDVLSGSYTGEIYFFERIDSGELAQGRFLTVADGSPLECESSVTPECIDMDGDGDLDLVIGTRSSGVFVYENEGTREEPVWSVDSMRVLTVGGERVMGSNAHHADWDGDGVRDLVLGSEYGEIAWYRNVGTTTEPSYGERAILIPRRELVEIEEGTMPARPGSRAKVHVTDYDGDGRADLLVGDVQWHTEMLEPLTAEQEEEKAALTPGYEAAKKEYYDLIDERNSYVGEEGGIPQDVLDRMAAAGEKFQPFAEKMAAFDREKSVTHGFVWLYLRSGGASSPDPIRSESDSSGPASFQVSATPIPGKPGEFRLTARLELTDGWHVYAEVPADGAYPVTAISQTWPEGIRSRSEWTASTESVPDPENPDTRWFVDEAVFECDVVVESDHDVDVTIELAFQACDESVCLPPGELTGTIRLGR